MELLVVQVVAQVVAVDRQQLMELQLKLVAQEQSMETMVETKVHLAAVMAQVVAAV
jgi:hypothetical protein